MSLIRPEIRTWAVRNAEPLAFGAVGLLGVWLGWLGLASGGWLAAMAGGAILMVGLLGLVAALRRARFRAAELAAGVVDITEARIGYYAPEGGQFVDLGSLEKLELVHHRNGDRSWVLHHDDGPPVYVPLGARGAERLVDLFAALPGMRMEAATAALDADGSFTIWKRSDPDPVTGTRVARSIGKH
ncbi:hypothetical protein ACW9UR_00625 [Halovulum sp. GXIMD14794]